DGDEDVAARLVDLVLIGHVRLALRRCDALSSHVRLRDAVGSSRHFCCAAHSASRHFCCAAHSASRQSHTRISWMRVKLPWWCRLTPLAQASMFWAWRRLTSAYTLPLSRKPFSSGIESERR